MIFDTMHKERELCGGRVGRSHRNERMFHMYSQTLNSGVSRCVHLDGASPAKVNLG